MFNGNYKRVYFAVQSALVAGALSTTFNVWAQTRVMPSSLLAVDQNREQIVTRILEEFGDAIADMSKAAPEQGVTAVTVRAKLERLRADQLLSASMKIGRAHV